MPCTRRERRICHAATVLLFAPGLMRGYAVMLVSIREGTPNKINYVNLKVRIQISQADILFLAHASLLSRGEHGSSKGGNLCPPN